MSQPETTAELTSPREESLPPPLITLTKCALRPIHPLDAPAVQRACNSPAMAKYMTYRFPSPYTLEDAHRFIAFVSTLRVPGYPDINPSMAICDPATNELIGSIGIKLKEDIEEFCFELGYSLREEDWGKGIMTEACRAYCKWLFEMYPKVIRLEAGVFGGNDGNDGSARVLEKCGFVHEGTRRKAVTKHGQVYDLRMYGLLREERERLE
ncbi:hypothetical protein VTI28DRAFT_5829 [Corynascus sepedonium]